MLSLFVWRIEAQLNQDQAGAVKPDIHTPFRDKKDACIRLIRYHCMDQPVLSQKDLHKADEIFELTAEHFIAKYAKMVDKYKYLLMKESMVSTRMDSGSPHANFMWRFHFYGVLDFS